MTILYDSEDRILNQKEGENLLETCIRNKVNISHSCEGMASCGTCRVIVTEGLEGLEHRNFLEQEMADDRKFADHERLACQIYPDKDLSFKLPHE